MFFVKKSDFGKNKQTKWIWLEYSKYIKHEFWEIKEFHLNPVYIFFKQTTVTNFGIH